MTQGSSPHSADEWEAAGGESHYMPAAHAGRRENNGRTGKTGRDGGKETPAGGPRSPPLRPRKQPPRQNHSRPDPPPRAQSQSASLARLSPPATSPSHGPPRQPRPPPAAHQVSRLRRAEAQSPEGQRPASPKHRGPLNGSQSPPCPWQQPDPIQPRSPGGHHQPQAQGGPTDGPQVRPAHGSRKRQARQRPMRGAACSGHAAAPLTGG